ncbi:hypothetical protein TNCV_3815621 [Trichonephila clavipes]|nr:hypothetical protein TNCV_3815621 [Trichonephila clavipes]
MAASSSSFIPTPLAHADTLGEGHPRWNLGEGHPRWNLGEGHPRWNLGEGHPRWNLGEGHPRWAPLQSLEDTVARQPIKANAYCVQLSIRDLGHEQMFRSGGQSEEVPQVSKSQ